MKALLYHGSIERYLQSVEIGEEFTACGHGSQRFVIRETCCMVQQGMPEYNYPACYSINDEGHEKKELPEELFARQDAANMDIRDINRIVYDYCLRKYMEASK